MKQPALLLLFALLAALAGAAPASAGMAGAPVLNTPIGARSSGMGRAFTAVPGDPEALNYNPGALAFARGGNISATYKSGFFDSSYGFLAAPLPLGPFVLTPAYLFFNSGPITLRFSDLAKAVETVTAESDQVIYLSAGWRPKPELGIGATIKRASLELAETASASSLHFDVGVLYAAKNGLRFGASLLNSGGDITFKEKGDPAPRTKKIGASYKFEVKPPNLLDPGADITGCDMLLSADWTRTEGEKGYYQGGIETNMALARSVIFTYRMGYLAGRDSVGITYGLGLGGKKWGFDFSFAPSQSLGAVSQATVNHKF